MSEKNLESLDIAQNGAEAATNPVPTRLNVETPMLDRMSMERQFGGYQAPSDPSPLPNFASADNVYPDAPPPTSIPRGDEGSDLKSLENFLLTPTPTKDGGSVMRTLDEVSSNRYDNFVPGDYNNEDAYAQGQGWPSKMINGVGKGLLLTGTTFLQGTAGLLNGLARWGADGRFASFYDNEFNRQLDEINKKAEDLLPNYYTDKEKNGKWYSPDYFMTGNFLWDSVVKNMGFAAGAYLTGGVYSSAIKGLAALPGASRLLSIGKAAEAVAESEKALVGLDKASEAYSKIKGLNDAFLRTYNVLDKGHRAVVAGLSTTGEAGFEAYTNLNEFRNQKIQEYRDANNGLDPVGSDLEKINADADGVGNASFLANVALLSATNYIQFPKILGSSYTAEKGIINNVTREIGDITTDAAGRYVASIPKNKVLATLNKVRPYVFSVPESIEEGSQFAIQMGTQDYYNKKYNNQATDWLEAASTGIGSAFGTDEGAKNILIGGLSGALMMARSNFREGREKSTNTSTAAEQFNKFRFSDFTKETIDSVNRGTTLQEERENLLKQGNITESKDKETDYIINYLTPRIKYGRYDLVTADIADQRTLASTEDGFDQLVKEGKALPTDTKEAYLERLNKFAETAENIKTMYQSLNLRYGGKVNEDGTAMYPPAVIDKLIYAGTKLADYDNRIPRLSQKLITTVDGVDQILSDVSEGNLDSYNEALAKIQANTKLTSDQKEDLVEALDDSALMTIKRTMFVKEYDAIKNNPQEFKEEPIVEETFDDPDAPKETVTIKTKNGDRKIEIGTEYVLGKVTEYDAKGKEVYRQPRLIVLGVNEDGTIKIKPSNAPIRDVSVEEFESYSLTPARLMLTNKKFNYFEKHQNTVFKNYNIRDKNGDAVVGRLEYNNKKDKLTFVYLDDNGKIQKEEVWNKMFKAKEGYSGASIRPIGVLTAVQQKAEDEFVNGETTISQKLQTRNRIISDLYENTFKRIEQINKKLENSKEAVEKEQQRLEEEIAKESLTKTGKVRKRPTTVLKQLINTLANLRDTVEKENTQLIQEKAELESSLPFFKDFLESLETLPQSGAKMIAQLKEDIDTLENLIDSTNDAIESSDSLLKQIDDMLKEALSIFNDYIKRLREENPDVPLFIEDLQANVERFLGEEGARMFIENRQGFTEKVIQLESDINDFSDELKIPELSKKSENLTKELSELRDKLDKLINEQLAKATILETFQQFAEDEKAREAEENKMREDENLQKSFLGTLTNAIQNFFGTSFYEAAAKKDEFEVVGGTKPAKDNIPHQQRANFFGNKLETFTNKNQLRGMIVTANTEDDIIPGLTEDFLQDMKEGPKKEEARKQIIYMVMVQDNQDGTFSVVDQNGQPILNDENKINNAVYQVFPSAGLTAEYDGVKETMFRADVSKDVRTSLTEQYAAWREDQLSKVELTADDMQEFSASFGQAKLVTVKDVSGNDVVDKGARTSAQAAGLVTQSGLRKSPIVEVATSAESVTEGSVTFATPKGRVFLRIPGRGLAKLFNRKFNKQEAEVIFDVMHQITKNAMTGEDLNDTSKDLFDWLKSVTYWGIAKNQDGTKKPGGYNNIYFEKVKDAEGKPVVKLFISGLEKDSSEYFDFTPTGLRNNRDAIITLLQGMYNNTDALKVNGDGWNSPYYEILGINREGKAITREWPNYQTYLLSDKAPDANIGGKLTVERTNKELPLATQFRPITESQPINREGIYFTLNSTGRTYVKPEPVVVASQPVVAQAEITGPKEFNDDGTTPNTIEHPDYGNIVFTLDKEGNVGFDLEGSEDAILELAKKKTAVGKSDEEAQNWAVSNLIKAIENKVKGQAETAPAPKPATAPIPAASPSDQIVEFDDETPNTLETDYGIVMYFANERGEVNLNLDESEEAIINLAEQKNIDHNKAANVLERSIERKIAPQLVQQQIPNLPPVADSTLPYKVGDIITIDTTYGLQEVEITAIDETKPLVANYLSYKYVNKVTNDKGQTVIGGNMNQKSFEDSIQVQPAQVQTQDQITEVIEKEEYDNFIDNGVVTDERIEFIANKIKNNEPLSPREIEIFTDKTSEINAKLAEISKATPDDVSWNEPVKPTSGRVRKLYRLAIRNKMQDIAPENWKQVEDFIKKVMPNVPVYRVKNIIDATNGRQAWGMFHQGAIYVYEDAEIGTAYHEVFEAVWKMFAGPAEKQAIFKEFRSRKGSFYDEFQEKEIKYSEATNEEVKEKLAEEFRDAVLANKLGKPLASKGLIGKLFSELIDFIKGFFTGKNAQANTKELFNKIGDGFYSQYNPFETKLSYANKGIQEVESAQGDATSDYRLKVKNIPATQLHDIIQHMTYSTLSYLSQTNQSLFEVEKPKKGELYARLRKEILRDCILELRAELVNDKTISEEQRTSEENKLQDLFDKIKEEWPAIVQKHEEHLKSYAIEFDENDELNINDEDNSGKSDYMDARKIDSFRKANRVIKLLLATLPKTKIVKGEIIPDISTIGGVTLMPADQAFITLMNALHSSVNVDEMFERLRTMAKSNPNFEVLYTRLTANSPLNRKVNWESLRQHDLQLVSAFWSSMKKQNADVVTMFVLPSGEVVIGNSVLSGAARQAKREMINNITESIRTDNNDYLFYNKKTQKYNPKSITKNISFNSGQLDQYIAFLQGTGITFNIGNSKKPLTGDELKSMLNADQLRMFRKAVEGIQNSFAGLDDVATLNSKTLNIDKRLTQLGAIKAILENPDFESTYFNINGERTQSFIGTNAISTLHDVLSKLTNIEQLSDSTKGFSSYKYLLTDKFAKGSVMLSKMFDLAEDGDGGRVAGTEDLMKPVFIDGTINEKTGKKKESSKLSAKQRFIQSINLNIAGIYENLVPGDASIEHAIKMHNDMFGRDADSFVTEEAFKNGKHLEIFRDYFISEVELSKDKRKVVSGKNSKDLRFFKSILGDAVHKKIMATAKSKTAEQLYEDNKKEINAAVNKFIAEDASATENMLRNFGAVYTTAEGIETEDLEFSEDGNLSKDEFDTKMKVLSTNYMIANIEMHKLIYSDPYQYADELKRIKNFNSPRQAMLYGSQKINAAFTNEYNKGYNPGDIGYTDMNVDHFVSTVIGDVFSTEDFDEYMKPYEETDGGGFIIAKANRVFLLRTGQWNDAKEKQYRYDVAYEKTVKGEGLTEKEKKEEGLALTDEEKAFNIKKTVIDGKTKYIGKNPGVRSIYTAIKPIVSGNKADGNTYNDVVLDKFALVPLSFRILHELNPDSNALKMYNKMQRENTDYAVYESGRKVGTNLVTPLYLPSGEFNESSFAELNNIPFSIMGLQTEVPSKDNPIVTQGSQITKLVTMDFLEAGVPIDFVIKDKDGNVIEELDERFLAWSELKTESEKEKASPLYKEISNNRTLLEAKIEQGYKTLLKKLGIERNRKGFVISDKDRLIKTLRDEILKRQVNDNIIDALEGFKDGDVVLEATPAYQQIRNILYSIADKNISSQKISGGMKVQISSALLESNRVKGKEFKDKNGNVKYSYTSDVLKFYKNKDGERVCEIMISRWFDNAQTKNMTDEQLLEYLNTTEEGKKILEGIGYRIPTQKQNSIDVFRIAKFLPKDFGDSVVIPSALVKKVGSDFDIDKLSIYLKNIYSDAKGKLRLVPFLGYGQQAIDKFKAIAIENNNAEIYKQAKSINSSKGTYELFQSIVDGTADDYTRNKWLPIIADWFPEQVQDGQLYVDEIQNRLLKTIEEKQGKLEKLTDETLTEIWAESQAEIWYKQSLENAYIQSLQNLVSHEANFDNLIKPNSADEMKQLSMDINKEMGNPEIDYGAVGNMLSRSFMSSLRQAFVSGKYAIGIAATGQTNHADNQRTSTYIDIDKIKDLDPVDKELLGGNPRSTLFAKDPNVNFEKYNTIKIDGVERPTLALIKNQAGKYISDIIGQFIDGYVDISKGPWIMRLGANPNVTSTWLFLIKLGVPANTVGYFMNQPIVRDYLRSLDNNGYSWIFNDRIMGEMLSVYEPNAATLKSTTVSGIPSEDELFKMLKYNKIGTKTEMTDVQKLQQQYILKEFIKYSKMSSQLFDVVQGSNFDTATINDPYLVFKKMLQLEKARKSIISSVDKLLDSSFKGTLKDAIFDVRDAFAQILISDKPNVRSVMESVLTPYVSLSDRDFVKVSQKAVNDLFDWAVQTDRSINVNVANILLGSDTKASAAQQIIDFRDSILGNKHKGISQKPNHPLYDNIILNSIKMEAGSKEGKADNLYIAGRDNKVYDQNLIIYGFEELKKHLDGQGSDLYGKLVRLAVIQSGLTNSPIAFTNLLPYKDFKELYNKTLSNLENMPNLADFKNLLVFERNNWNNYNIIPFMKAKMLLGKANYGRPAQLYDPNQYFTPESLKNATKAGTLPMVVGISPFGDGRNDFITYSWEDSIPYAERVARRKRGDYSHIHKVLLQKVYTKDDKGNPIPLVDVSEKNGKVYVKHIFKAINAWGDSFRAQEFYDHERSSVLDNGYEKVEKVTDVQGKKIKSGEVTDDDVVKAYGGIQEDERDMGLTADMFEDYSIKPTQSPVSNIGPETKINIYDSTRENPELSNFAIRPFVLKDDDLSLDMGANFKRKFYSVEQGFQYIKSIVAGDPFKNSIEVSEKIAKETNGAKLKALGNKSSLNTTEQGLKEWDRMSETFMYELLLASFKQNSEALQKLLATGNATLTHTQDKTKWGKEFPRLLMKVREELRPTVTKEPKKVVTQPKTLNQYKAIDDKNIKDQLVNKDYYFEIGETNKPIKINKGNLERYLKNAGNPEWMLLTKGMDGKFYEAKMPEPVYNISLENGSMEYVSIQDMVEDVIVGDANYALSPKEKQAAIDYLKQYGIDVATSSNEKVKVDNSTLKDGDVVYDKLGTKFIFRGLRQPGQAGAGSPRLEETNGSGQIVIPGVNIELFKEAISEKPGLISGSASNIFNEILQAHYGEFIFKSSEYYKKHGLSAPAIYSTPFSDSINSIIKNNKEFNLTGAQPIFTRIASIFENRIANGKTGMEETINFINTRLNTNIKVDISKYENLAKQSLKSDNDIMINVMSNTKLSTQEKLDKTKANTDLQNQRIVAAVDIVNDIFSQIDKSIPKLSTRPALGANQAVADYTKEDQVKILIVNMKARPENTKDVLKKYGLTIDTFSKNFEKYYTESLQAVNQKPESVSQEEWDALSQEEKNKINEC